MVQQAIIDCLQVFLMNIIILIRCRMIALNTTSLTIAYFEKVLLMAFASSLLPDDLAINTKPNLIH